MFCCSKFLGWLCNRTLALGLLLVIGGLSASLLLFPGNVTADEKECRDEVVKVQGKMAYSKEAGQFHAVRAWSKKTVELFDKKYSWFKAERTDENACEEKEGRWICTAAARPCE